MYDECMKKYLSNSKDNKLQKSKNNLNKPFFDNNINLNYNNSHFSPINKINKDDKNYYINYFYNNIITKENKSHKNIAGNNNNKINIDINLNNNINYIYIFKKNSLKNKSNNHLFTMK